GRLPDAAFSMRNCPPMRRLKGYTQFCTGSRRGAVGSGMGKETSYKNRHQMTPPDSYVGRRAVEQGLITEEQLAEALDRMHEDPAVPDQPVPTTLSAALLMCKLLSRQQVEQLLEGPPAPED